MFLTPDELDAQLDDLVRRMNLDTMLSDEADDDEADDIYFEDDGQPDEYTEWQDVYGGDDWDHGQYDEF